VVVALVPLVTGALASAVSPSSAAPAGRPGVDRVPNLPQIPDVPSSGVQGKVTARSVPASASVATGEWRIWNTGYGRASGTLITMPPAGGLPLLADWNGDGVGRAV
jgi:hypothetical protein